MWSIGIILYLITFNEKPFNNEYELLNYSNGNKKLDFTGLENNQVNIIKDLLQPDPNFRLSSQELLCRLHDITINLSSSITSGIIFIIYYSYGYIIIYLLYFRFICELV